MNIIEKVISYYKYHGFKETVKTGFRKLFPKLYKKTGAANKYANYIFNKESLKDAKDQVVLKSGSKIYIFAGVPYYDVGGGQRSAQLAKTFNKLGFEVNYIYAFESSESKVYKMDLPLCMHMFIEKLDDLAMQNLSSDDIFIFESPCDKFDKYLKLAVDKNVKIILKNMALKKKKYTIYLMLWMTNCLVHTNLTLFLMIYSLAQKLLHIMDHCGENGLTGIC